MKGFPLAEQAFSELVGIMARLRGPDGCPWDREQTHEKLKPYILEEAYEVLEALDGKVDAELAEELGDLLLQVVFHAQLASEERRFDIQDVIRILNEKLVRRHPHVFGDVVIHDAESQRVHWEGLKKKEGKTSVLQGVPVALPALLRAHRIQQKASTVGFDWGKPEPVWAKVNEEMRELVEADRANDHDAVNEEFGDLLFALVNLSRFLKVNPEDSLRLAVEKFINRFQKVESVMKSEGKDMKEATLDEMDEVWNRVKAEAKVDSGRK
jgi:tetrapyrrole methylase family protein / MazG family protein